MKLSVLVLGFAVSLSVMEPVGAAEPKVIFFEALPPHLSWRVERQRTLLRPAGANVSEGMIYRLKVWPPEAMPLKVCFFGGDPELRQQIRDAALRWATPPLKVSFDFGMDPQLRDCGASQQAQIRVGFSYRGYWSLVSQDAVYANQNEQTMNFQGFDIAPAAEPEFSRVVQHEFGHALGLGHEHQNPRGECENEYDWPAVYRLLAQEGWSKADVDKNMRSVSDVGVASGRFDERSIMLYTFPAEFYRNGNQSRCYAKPTYEVSESDFKFVASFYAVDVATQRRDIASAVSAVSAAISASTAQPSTKQAALKNLSVLTNFSAPIQQREQQVQEVLSTFALE